MVVQQGVRVFLLAFTVGFFLALATRSPPATRAKERSVLAPLNDSLLGDSGASTAGESTTAPFIEVTSNSRPVQLLRAMQARAARLSGQLSRGLVTRPTPAPQRRLRFR